MTDKVFNGTKLAVLRREASLSQQALAQKLKLGTSGNSKISSWEVGKKNPSDETVKILAKFFEISVEEFYTTNHSELRITTQPSQFSEAEIDYVNVRLDPPTRIVLVVVGEFFDSTDKIARDAKGNLYKVVPLT